MGSILVPVDGSVHAKNALKHAIGMIKEASPKLGLVAKVHVLYVKPQVLPMGELPLMDAALIEQVQHEQAKKAIRSARRLLNIAKVSYATHILTGAIASTIVNVAKAQACNRIIMGTRGMGVLANIILGSTAMQVVRLAKVPVTLVK